MSAKRQNKIPSFGSEIRQNDVDRVDDVLKMGAAGQFESVLSKLIELTPEDEEASRLVHFAKGMQALGEGDCYGGLVEFQTILKGKAVNDPEFEAMVKLFCGLAHLSMHATRDALALADEASAVLSRSPMVSVLKGSVLVELGSYSLALDEFERARQFSQERLTKAQDESVPDAGSHHLWTGFLESALETSLLPGIDVLIGEAYLGLGKTKEARNQFSNLIEEGKPLYPPLLFQAAKGFSRLGEYQQALKIADSLEEQYPDRLEHHLIRGLVKVKLDDRSALDDINLAVLKTPQRLDASIVKAVLQGSEKDFTGAIKTLGRLVNMNPKNPEVYLLRGALCLDQGDMAGAVEDFQEARKILPEGPMSYFGLAIALSNQGKESDALRILEAGLELDHNSSFASYTKGMVNLNLGRDDQAIPCFERSIELDASDGECQYELGVAYHRIGRKDDAITKLSLAGKLGHMRAYEQIREITKKIPEETGSRVGAKSSKPRKYQLDELAEAYLQYVISTRKEKPSQSEMRGWKGISQSSWSRAYREAEFWEKTKTKLEAYAKESEAHREAMINALIVAEDNHDRKVAAIRTGKERSVTSPIERTRSDGGKVGTRKSRVGIKRKKPRQNTENKPTNSILEEYDGVSRIELTDMLIEKYPNLKRITLDQMDFEDLLELIEDNEDQARGADP